MIKNKSFANKLLTLIFIPIVGFIESMRDSYRSCSQVIIVLFCGYAGWLMGPYDKTMDLFVYIERINDLFSAGDSYYFAALAEYFSDSARQKDLYFETLVYFVSQFSNNYHIVYIFVGLIYGFFFAKSFGIITKYIRENGIINRYYGCILFIAFMSIPFTNISSIRFWTAAWIGVYIVLKVFIERKYYYLVLFLLAIFVHASFLILFVLCLVGLIAALIPGSSRLLPVVFFVTIPLSLLALVFADAIIGYLPASLQRSAELYFSEENIEKATQGGGTGFYLIGQIFFVLMYLYNYTIVTIIILRKRKTKDNDLFYIFTIVLLIFCNITMGIPSMGNRFFQIALVLVCCLWCLTFKHEEHRKLIFLTPIVYSFAFVYWVFNTVNATTRLLPLLNPIFSLL